MKKNVLIVAGLVLFVMTGFVTAAEEEGAAEGARVRTRTVPAAREKKPPTPTAADARRERLTSRGGRGQSPTARDQMYREMLAKQGEKHREALKELEDIKKIAEEEGATKTAEAIQALIDKKDADYKQNIEKAEKARAERAERVEQRLKDRQAREASKTEVKKDVDVDPHAGHDHD